MKRQFLSIIALVAIISLTIAGCAPAAAATQAAPTKPAFPEAGKVVSLVVPNNAGGSTDLAARTLAPYFSKELGITVEVVNKPGAGSQLGMTEVVKSKPDGYTLLVGNLPNPIVTYLNPDRQAAFKSKKDFGFFGSMVLDPGAIAVKADGPYQTVEDLIKAAKANPGGIKAATTGLLSDDHLGIINVQNNAGVEFAVVHFDGGAEREAALLGGKIDAAFGNVSSFYPSVKNGTVKILGVMDKKSWALLPDVATFESQGIPVYNAAVRGIFGPAGMDPQVHEILSAALQKAITNPEFMQKMKDLGQPVTYMSPADQEKKWDEIEGWITPIFLKALEENKTK